MTELSLLGDSRGAPDLMTRLGGGPPTPQLPESKGLSSCVTLGLSLCWGSGPDAPLHWPLPVALDLAEPGEAQQGSGGLGTGRQFFLSGQRVDTVPTFMSLA